MRKCALCVLALVSLAVGQNYFDMQMSVRNMFYGGIALAVGDGSSSMNPGITACMEPLKKINKYFGAGGHIDYTWLSMAKAKLPPNRGGGLNLFDIAFVPKGFVPIADDMSFSFETDPGLYGVYFYFSDGGYNNSEFLVRFGLTTAAAYNIGSFSFMFKFKTIFANDRFESVSTVNWIGFSAGIVL
jgi:hypothetical protein